MSKKGSKPATKDITSYQVRDIVLGKVRGYPPWPGMVVDPDSVPSEVSKERPTPRTGNFYCVRFFPRGDHAWLIQKDISKLQLHEIESYINEPYRKSGELLAGYRIALDPTKWEEEQKAISSQNAEEEVNEEVDQLQSENEDGESKKGGKSRKRKREAEAGASKAKKAPKTKKDTAEPAKGKGRKNGSRSKTLVESEDEGDAGDAVGEDADAGPSKKLSPPPTKKAKHGEEEGDESKLDRDPEALKVREWRHKLQKTFLSNKGLPKLEDMPALDQLFRTVETYEKINIQYLSFSKIGKVMRHIAVLPVEKVPRDEEYKFRDRAKALVEKWHQILNANKPNGENGASNANGTPSKDNAKDDDKKEDVVTTATAALDLNGAVNEDTSAEAAEGDVAMNEA